MVLLDSTGAGRAQFDEFLANPGLQALPAVADDKIMVLDATTMMSSGSGGIVALKQIAAWLHPDRFR